MEAKPISLNIKLCEQGGGTGRRAGWFVKSEGPAAVDEEWTPLWKYDSDIVEEKYQRGDINSDIPIRHRHAVANISARTVTETYFLNPKKEILRRGTWFWEKAKGKMVPFSESTAEAIDHWTTAVKLSTSALEGRWHHDLGEVLGPGKGQFTIVAKLVHKEAVAASEGKTEIRDVEVLTPTSSQNEIDSAVSDESNHFVFVLENRTNLLTSILAGMKVEYGYTLLAQPEERICGFRPGHLVFVVHGIGEAMFSQSDSPVPSIQACTEKFKTMSLESTHPIIEEDAFDIGYRSESGELRMVEYLAIEWWDAVHGDDQDITKQMKQITAPTVPLMRQFGNSAAMDILLYQTPEFQHRITASVCASMNYAHTRFCELNPDFNGDCSIIGHSLGSVISFDILSSQFVVSSSSSEVEQPTAPPLPIDRAEPNISLKEGNKEIVPTPTDALFASQAYMTEGKNMEKIAAQQLLFHPKAFFAIGSPIGIFATVRSKGRPFPPNFKLPTCPRLYNIFHPHDPVAYRLEPLFDPGLAKKEPFLIDHITGMTFHNRMKKFGAEISQSIDNISSAWNAASSPSTWFAAPSIAPQPAALTATAIARENTGLFASWFRGSEITPVAQQVAPLSVKTKKVSAHAWSSLDDELEGIMANQEKRIDYVLQESTLEVANQYMSALFAHSSYFENKDFLQFTLNQIAAHNGKITKSTD